MSKEFLRFHNALRIMRSIDFDEFHAASGLNEASWAEFTYNPYHFFIRADDATALAIWSIIERRQSS